MSEDNLTPGQVVQTEDGTVYSIVQLEDGSLGFQPLPDYQINEEQGENIAYDIAPQENEIDENIPQDLTILQNVNNMNVPETMNSSNQPIENPVINIEPPQEMNNQNEVGGINDEANQIYVSEERYQQVVAFIQHLQSQGYDVGQDTINQLMSGEMEIPEVSFEENGDQSSEMPTQNDTNNIQSQLPTVTDNLTSEQTVTEANAPAHTIPTENASASFQKNAVTADMNYNLDDDEEFKFLREMMQPEEIGKPCKLPGAKIPEENEFKLAFIRFLKSNGQGLTISENQSPRENNNSMYTPAPNGYSTPFDDPSRNQYPFGERPPSTLTGRVRGGAKFVQHRIARQRNDSDESDFEYPSHNYDEGMQRPYHPAPTRGTGKRGRPRGSTSKKYELSSSDDFSDLSDDSFQKPRRGRPNQTQNISGPNQKRRGRPRKYPIPEISNIPNQMPGAGMVLFTSNDDFHGYREGDFVIERENYFQKSLCDVYCISDKSCLSRYEFFVLDDNILHKRTSFVMGVTGLAEIRDKYKAVTVENLIATHDRQRIECIKLKLPCENINLNQLQMHPLWDMFKLYVEALCYNAIDANLMASILKGDHPHHQESIIQIDRVVSESINILLQIKQWAPQFNTAIDNMPYYKICEMSGVRHGQVFKCHEVENLYLSANRVITLFGPRYNSESLEMEETNNISDIEMLNSVDFYIHESSIEHIQLYHGLKHFKMMLFKEAFHTLSNIALKDPSRTPQDMIAEIQNNTPRWIQYHFMNFANAIAKAGIVIQVN